MAKVTKLIKWISPNGADIEVVIELSKSVEKYISYSDGWNIDLGDKVEEFKKISVYVNGKYHESTYNNPVIVKDGLFTDDYKAKVKAGGGYARLTDGVIINEEKYNLIMTEIGNAETELEELFKKENPEMSVLVKKMEAEKIEQEKAIDREWANKVMEEYAIRNTEILSKANEKIWMKNYNNIQNEGGEGYVPNRITLEDVEKAKSILA